MSDDGGTGGGPGRTRAAVVALVLGLLVLVGLLLVPAEPPGLRPTNVFNAVFNDRWMIGAVRLVVLAVGMYLVASVSALSVRGQWVRRVGPVDAAATVQTVAEDQDTLRSELDRAKATIEELRAELDASLALNEELLNTVDTAGADPAAGEGTPHDVAAEGSGPGADRSGPPGA